MTKGDLATFVGSVTSVQQSLLQVQNSVSQLVIGTGHTNKMADTGGHYQASNKLAVEVRPFVELRSLLKILTDMYLFRVTPDVGVSRLKDLSKNAMQLGEGVRFPENRIYVDIRRGTCATKFYNILHSNKQDSQDVVTRANSLLNDLESYETCMRSSTYSGVCDRNYFESSFAAIWIPKQ